MVRSEAPGSLAAVRRAFADPAVSVAGMRQVIEHPGRVYRTIESAADRRVRRGWVYGDSGLCVRRELYEAVGGFRVDLPLFEDLDLSRRLRALAPEIPSFFSRDDAREFVLRFKSGLWWRYRARGVSMQIPPRVGRWQLDRPELIARAQAHGVRVLYWTINERDEMRRLLELGADGIITDRPGLLREVLGHE